MGGEVERRRRVEGGGLGRETGEERAREEKREVSRREGEMEVGRGGKMYEERGGREGRVMKRYPTLLHVARMYSLQYLSFTSSYSDKVTRNTLLKAFKEHDTWPSSKRCQYLAHRARAEAKASQGAYGNTSAWKPTSPPSAPTTTPPSRANPSIAGDECDDDRNSATKSWATTGCCLIVDNSRRADDEMTESAGKDTHLRAPSVACSLVVTGDPSSKRYAP